MIIAIFLSFLKTVDEGIYCTKKNSLTGLAREFLII